MKRIWILDYDGYFENEGIMDIGGATKTEAGAITISKSECNRQLSLKTWTFVHRIVFYLLFL